MIKETLIKFIQEEGSTVGFAIWTFCIFIIGFVEGIVFRKTSHIIGNRRSDG